MSKAITCKFKRRKYIKLLKCVIRPSALEQVKNSLKKLGVVGITVNEVRGFGRQKGHTEIYRGAEYANDFTPKLNIEVVVTNDVSEQCVDVISEASKTGNIGDGKIFIVPVDEVVRIRTGETGDSAI